MDKGDGGGDALQHDDARVPVGDEAAALPDDDDDAADDGQAAEDGILDHVAEAMCASDERVVVAGDNVGVDKDERIARRFAPRPREDDGRG